MKKVAIYARVSTGKQAESDLSIPDQVKRCEAYAEAHGWEIAQTFVDEGRSATTDNRPAFQEMIAAAEDARAFDVVLVHSQSRFARNLEHLMQYRRRLKKAGVDLISITQDVGAGAASDLALNVMGMMDEYQSQETSKHVSRSMAENARQGFWNGSKPPLGYAAKEVEKRGTKSKKKLVVSSSEADLINLIFRLYVYGDGTSGPLGVKLIASYLNEREYKTRDGKPFRLQYIQKILRNTVYIGEYYFNKTESKTRQPRPREQWIKVDAPRIIAPNTFSAAQEKLSRQHPLKTPPRLTNSGVLLTKIAVCGKCGGPLRKQTGKNNQYHYYKCAKKADKGGTACKGVSIPMAELDDTVIEAMLDRILKPERLQALLGILVERASERKAEFTARIKELRNARAEEKQKLDRLYEAIEDGLVDPDSQYRSRIQDRQETIERLSSQISDLERRRDTVRRQLRPEDYEAFTEAFTKTLKSEDKKFARAYLHAIIAEVSVSADQITISGSKEVLLAQTADIAETGKPVLSFEQGWRSRQDSNL